MSGDARVKRSDRRSWIRLLAINAAIFVVGFLVLDAIVSGTPVIYRLAPNAFRIHDAQLHHALAANVDDVGANWGGLKYRFSTNSLGYRDAVARQVAPRSDKPFRVLLLGDSFTEAVGMPWERSFAGLFAANRPDLDVLDGGVSSYAPSMYFKATERLLQRGYSVDAVVVFIDISDVQDEALYSFDAAGNIVDSDFIVDTYAHVDAAPTRIQRRRSKWEATSIGQAVRRVEIFFGEHFIMTKTLGVLIRNVFRKGRFSTAAQAASTAPVIAPGECRQPQLCLVRSMWTVEGAKLTAGYGDLGVEGAIAKAEHEMDRLAALLRSRNIRFSVGVYPWPDQMRFDQIESRQVRVWRDWCRRAGCETFIDVFPDFFAVRDTHDDWLARLYIPGDFHFNAEGNRLLAARLGAQTSALFRPGR